MNFCWFWGIRFAWPCVYKDQCNRVLAISLRHLVVCRFSGMLVMHYTLSGICLYLNFIYVFHSFSDTASVLYLIFDFCIRLIGGCSSFAVFIVIVNQILLPYNVSGGRNWQKENLGGLSRSEYLSFSIWWYTVNNTVCSILLEIYHTFLLVLPCEGVK